MINKVNFELSLAFAAASFAAFSEHFLVLALVVGYPGLVVDIFLFEALVIEDWEVFQPFEHEFAEKTIRGILRFTLVSGAALALASYYEIIAVEKVRKFGNINKSLAN